MKLGHIEGYTLTIGGYSSPLKEHRGNTTVLSVRRAIRVANVSDQSSTCRQHHHQSKCPVCTDHEEGLRTETFTDDDDAACMLKTDRRHSRHGLPV